MIGRSRRLAAVAGGKMAAAVSRRLGRGGTALPGLVAAHIDPGLLDHMAEQLGHGSIVVTGTNGKTTTARMLAAIARAAGWRVVHNRSGSNLMRGLSATAIGASDLFGNVPHGEDTFGVFEVDEATLPLAAPALAPRATVFTNLFRDQLDRYGEVDGISALWRKALPSFDPRSSVVLNVDDPSVAALSDAWSGRTVTFGVEDRTHATIAEHAADARWCAACGAEYRYEALYFGHIGVWECPGCGRRRPVPDVAGVSVHLAPDAATRLCVTTPSGRLGVDLPLAGLYNAYNALAAIAGATTCGLPLDAVVRGLSGVEAAFGRQEQMVARGRTVRLLLCKNPAGVNQVLRLLCSESPPLYLLIVLNDGTADGHDISWIWDVDYELLAGRVARVVVSGRRVDDMALRLKYAGLSHALVVERDQRRAVLRALAMTPIGARLSALPTYTAMLGVREQVAELSGRSHFWEE